MKHFFAAAIKTDQLGHVLFFSTKPACFFIVDLAEEEDTFTKSWNVWKSKEHLFQHHNFIVYEEICEKKAYVYFINKQTLLSQFSRKEELLKKMFGESFSIKDLVVKLEQNTFDSLICKNKILLGMLLGYGIESVLDYPQYIAPDPYASSKELISILCATDSKITTTSLEDNVMLCTFKSKAAIHPVSFIGDPNSEEVKSLKAIYSQELEKIEMIYQRKDLLRICLEKLCRG